MQSQKSYIFNGYTIHPSDRPDKKYYAQSPTKRIYFGDPQFQQYRDKIGLFSHLDHRDPQRRRAFLSRFKRCADKPGTPCFFSAKLLW